MRLSRTLGLLSLGALLLSLFGFLAGQAQAQTAPANANFSVAAGQTATVNVNVFCLDFGKDFPTGQPVEPNKLADAKLISALQYAVSKGYDSSNPRQVQLAMWYLRDNTYHTNSGEASTQAQEIVKSASASSTVTGTTPAAGATTLQDAILNNQVKFGVTGLKSNISGEYFGSAVLQITNLTSSSLNLYLPFGSTFGATGANFQSLIGYATGTSGAAQATTAAATTTSAATTVAATTDTATTSAATTAAATTTPVVTSTSTATTAASTTAATTSATSTTPATTPVTAPVTTTAVATVAATTVANTTAATAQGGAVSVPATGRGGATTVAAESDSFVPLVILLLLATVAIAATGLLIAKRVPRR